MPSVTEIFTYDAATFGSTYQSLDLTPPLASSSASVESAWAPLYQNGQLAKKQFRVFFKTVATIIGKEYTNRTETVSVTLGAHTYVIGMINNSNPGLYFRPNNKYTMTNCQVGGRYVGRNVTMTLETDNTLVRKLTITSTW
jgi:hypothetical protein